MNQYIAYNPQPWFQEFPNDQDIIEIVGEHPNGLSREDIANIGGLAINGNAHIRKLFLATMIWGYGTAGYGPHRTHLMLQSPNVNEILLASFNAVAQGQIAQAYVNFQIKWCGPPFFTKFFYFVGLLHNVQPLPLIFDSRVATTFKLLLDDLHLDSHDYGISRSDNGRWYPRRYAPGYVAYINTINCWAHELECRPDAIELFLFDPGYPFRNWHGD